MPAKPLMNFLEAKFLQNIPHQKIILPLCSVNMFDPIVRVSFEERSLFRLERIELPAPKAEGPGGRSLTC